MARPDRKPPVRSSPPPPAARQRVEHENEASQRLQKVLAHAGVGSRRACEEFILQGRITINGKVVRELGTKVTPGRDKVAVDGEPIHHERLAYIAVNKPKGYVSTNSDPAGRPRVVDLIPDIPQRVYTVGRLDEMSVGLMILTNDGELANRLAHPKYGVEKIYRAVVAGSPQEEVYKKLTEGVWLAEGKVRAKRVRPVGKQGEATILEMVLAEGKNREVRRMLAQLGHKVMSLVRVSVGPITIKGLKPGGWRFLTSRELELPAPDCRGVTDFLKRVPRGTPATSFAQPSRRAPQRAEICSVPEIETTLSGASDSRGKPASASATEAKDHRTRFTTRITVGKTPGTAKKARDASSSSTPSDRQKTAQAHSKKTPRRWGRDMSLALTN